MQNGLKERLEECLKNMDYESYIKSNTVQIVRKMYDEGRSVGDIETCAILVSVVSWGPQNQSLEAAYNIMDMCNWNPLEFIKLGDFYDIPDDAKIYRTLKGKGFKDMCHSLRMFYNKHESIQQVIMENPSLTVDDVFIALCKWGEPANLGSPYKNSACKRISLLMRWMVRKDKVDMGLWQHGLVQPAKLYAVMDKNVNRIISEAGFVSYPKESWRAVGELTYLYRSWDSEDPLKYDLVLTNNNI